MAHYSGLVTLVDTWFGKFVDQLKRLDLWNNSVVVFVSDHGTNFADNPEGVIGKPHYSMYPGLMNIPLLIHLPGEEGATEEIADLVYNIDIPATFYQLAGLELNDSVEGRSLLPYLKGEGRQESRKYVTCRYGETVWYRDERHWAIIRTDGKPRALFDLKEDPDCDNDLLDEDGRDDREVNDIVDKAWERILADAGGEIPIYNVSGRTDALGRFAAGE